MPGQKNIRILVTGGTSGLGLELVKLFLADGAEVYATGRNNPDFLNNHPGFHFSQVDFSELKQVQSVMEKILSSETGLDLVVNCAGVLTPPGYTVTKDGFEYSFQVNFLAHLMIGDIILSSPRQAGPVKLVYVTSPVYKYVRPTFRLPEEIGFRPFRVYCESKYYMILTGSYLSSIYNGKDVNVLSLDPGIFSSGIYRMQKGWFRKMYMIAAPFMRSSRKVAKNLHKIMISEDLADSMIYEQSGNRSHPYPSMNETSLKFMETCLSELKKRY